MTESSKPSPDGVPGKARRQSGSESSNSYSSFLPTIGLAITLLVVVVFETVQLSMENAAIEAVKNNQYPAFLESKKMRAQFNSIAQGVAKLAASGNTNATAIVRELNTQGVTISVGSESMP